MYDLNFLEDKRFYCFLNFLVYYMLDYIYLVC